MDVLWLIRNVINMDIAYKIELQLGTVLSDAIFIWVSPNRGVIVILTTLGRRVGERSSRCFNHSSENAAAHSLVLSISRLLRLPKEESV